MSTPETTPSAEQIAAGEDPRGVPPAPRRGGNVQSMVLSMAVILAFVAVVVWLIPRPNAIEQPAVDVRNAAAGAVSQLPFNPVVPDVPQGWTATSANVNRSTDGVLTWHVGYRTDGGKYLALETAQGTTRTWLKAQTQSGDADGEQTIDGQAWQRYLQPDRERYSLTRTQDGQTLLVTGEGGYDLLAQLVTAAEQGWADAGTPWGVKEG
ncbi:DUF4245 domain-containing protein [Kineococcus rhizosphaerae]|uniref:DUF4245 domain-containing protein n=1 Tax=Kineococcus rhizosphaerae TaxID=559628 RepID=UPI0014765EFB|nr:DUF4245 domain-containing protein [Kineococcus rhizosphaerae]